MKTIKFGNILEVENDQSSGVNFIVHGCNAQGVMGAGLALDIRNRWPAVYSSYRAVCKSEGLSSSDLLGMVIPVEVKPGLFVLNAITQQNFGRSPIKYVSYRAVSEAFTQILDLAHSLNAQVHYPLIGAGLAGGDWSVISSIIDERFSKYPSIHRTLWIYD
jgi:O-acetyl-ADP-ribose deacetylase (regulator of RNase III)